MMSSGGVPQAPPISPPLPPAPPPLPPTPPPPRLPRSPLRPCMLRHVRVQPTSSASLLLTNATPFHASACGSRPIAEVLWQRPAGSEWQPAAQVGKHGETFPLEICGAHCLAPLGCRIAVKLRNGVLLNATALVPVVLTGMGGARRGLADADASTSASSPLLASPSLLASAASPSTAASGHVVFTPPPTRAPVHVPGARLELLLKPPLSPVTEAAAAPLVEAMLAQLNDHYFVMRSNRIKLAELSTTGAFMMLDVIPEDIFACNLLQSTRPLSIPRLDSPSFSPVSCRVVLQHSHCHSRIDPAPPSLLLRRPVRPRRAQDSPSSGPASRCAQPQRPCHRRPLRTLAAGDARQGRCDPQGASCHAAMAPSSGCTTAAWGRARHA